MTQIRMRGRDELAIEIDGREVRLPGELTASGSRYGFLLERSDYWRWADGSKLSDAERRVVKEEIERAGAAEGWIIAFDEATPGYRGATRAYFEFEGYQRLRFHRPDGTVVMIQGNLGFEATTPVFGLEPATHWITVDGVVVDPDEREVIMAELLEAARVKGVRIAQEPRG